MGNKKPSALEALYIEYKDHLYNYVYRLSNNPDVAQDVVQQTFLKLMHDPNINSLSHPKAYLFTVARNTLYDQWKRKREVPLTESEQEEFGNMADETETAPQSQVQQADLQEKIGSYLRTMPERPRELMLLRYVEDLSVKEIAHVTGRSLSDVKVNLHRARIKFDHGFTKHMYAKVAASRDTCDELTRMLAPYADEVPADQLPVVEKHLQTCQVCANDAEEMKRARKLFAALPLVAVPVALDSTLRTAMAAELGSTVAGGAAVGGTAASGTAAATGGSAAAGTTAAAGKTIGAKVAAGVLVASLGGAGVYLASKDNSKPVAQPTETTIQQAKQETTTGATVNVEATARLKENGQHIKDGVNWRVQRLAPDADDTSRTTWVTASSAAQPNFKLAPGDYLVTARYGEVRQQQKVTVTTDKPLQLDFTLGAGFLNAAARLSSDSPALDSGVRFKVHEAIPDKDDKHAYVTHFGSNQKGVKLPAGRYRVTAEFGGNSSVTREVEIVAGEQRDLDITLGTGYLQLGARLTSDGALLKNGVKFTIYEAEPDPQGKFKYVTFTQATQGVVNLPAGHYRVVTSYGTNTTHTIDDLVVDAGKRTVREDIVLGSGTLQLGARLKSGGPLLDSGVKFTIYNGEADAQGKHKYVTFTNANRKPVKLSSGRYRVVASYGVNASRTVDDVIVESGKRSLREDIIVDAGTLQLGAKLKPGAAELKSGVKFSVYEAEADVSGRYKYVTFTTPGRKPLKLKAGRYRVVATYGINAEVVDETSVKAGESARLDNMDLNAGEVTLRARTNNTKVDPKKIRFNVYEAETDISGKRKYLTQVRANAKPVKLAAGEYYVEARLDDTQSAETFSIQAGESKEVRIALN